MMLQRPPDLGYAYLQYFYGIEDAIQIWVQNGAEVTPPLQPYETAIEMTRQVGWQKQIAVMLGSSHALWAVGAPYSSDCSVPGPTLRLTQRQGDGGAVQASTIVFAKPKEFGNWVYMYHIDPVQFWPYFGGRKVTFCWERDDCDCGFGFLGKYYARVFRTGFEAGELQPTWPQWNATESLRGVSGQVCQAVSRDPTYFPEPHIGTRMLHCAGYTYTSSPNDGDYCYFRVFDVNIDIHPETYLIYWIHPQTDLGRYVGVDLVCTNGETLRNSGARDRYGAFMHPAWGHRRPTGDPQVYVDIPLNKWSWIACHVGKWLAGRTVDRILVPFVLPKHLWGTTGWFASYIDTIYLGEVPFGKTGMLGPIIPTTYS
jgi:hypothetical protein